MTNPKKPEKDTTAGGGTRRMRRQIYGDRITVSVRMDPEVHAGMMELCDDLALPANTYINSLIIADIKKRKKS